MKTSALVLSLTLALAGGNAVHADSAKPVVLMPPSFHHERCLKDLFEHPDEWKETRGKITSLGCADWLLNRDFTDAELKQWLPLVHQWGLKLMLEVGAIKEWGLTGAAAFAKDNTYWSRFEKLGGHIDAIAMDEPLCACRFNVHKSDDYALEETANFIQQVRKHYPEMKITETEGYPGIPAADLMKWIDALQARLKAKGVKTLDGFRLDVDWLNFVTAKKGNWPEVKQLEDFCRSRGIPFSLIYWAADFPFLADKGLSDDSTWYVSTMQMGYDYAAVGGTPDEYVVESWVDGPAQTVPETARWSFSRCVLDFCNKFVK